MAVMGVNQADSEDSRWIDRPLSDNEETKYNE
ncbi:hypothetical protein EYZ11_002513 [Aspergillus tanneri]|uniref:Uncharacterized protein n=1 Tax=Aspergillus tanneri TaxID=1220188 RepID=A0A4S3JU23_9EURO|nr:hypothetical protein EYZ11_002513 [Aspergillus tanneri]